MVFVFSCILLSVRAYGQFPLLYASNFAGTDGCNQVFLATTQSVTNSAGQDVIVDLKGDQGCAANPIASGFAGNLRFYNGTTFHLSTSNSPWIVPSKVIIMGAGDSSSIGNNLGTNIQACPVVNSAIGCPTAFPSDTPMMCFVDCTTTSSAQGFSISVWFVTLDCDYVAGCIVFRNYHAQENSGLYHDTLINYGNNGRGIDIGKSSGTLASGYHETLWRLNVGNTSASNGGTAICQLGAVGFYLAGSGSNVTLNPSSISDITVSNNECNTLQTNNGWPLPDYEWEVEGGNASIHNVHDEFMGVAGMLIGGNTPGIGAQVSVTASGGVLSSCTITNAGTGYNRGTGSTNFAVYASSGSGSVSVTFTSGAVTGCTVNAGSSGLPSTNLLAPINDSVVTEGAQNLLTEDIEACCATGAGTADNIRIASGGTFAGITLINTNEMSSAPTNVINDQNHTPIVGTTHPSVPLYMLNDAGNVVFDSSGTNAVVLPGVFSSGGTAAKGNLGVPVVVAVDNSGSLTTTYSSTLYTTPTSTSRGFMIMQWAEQSGLGSGCTGATTFKTNYTYTAVGQSAVTTVQTGSISISGVGTGGQTLLEYDPHYLQAKVNTSISATVTSFAAGTGCTTAPAYTLFTKLIQTD